MAGVEPFVREAGQGPGVVCLHANASSSSQWRALMDRLAPGHRVLAADSYGAGKTLAWPHERPLTLGDEAALLEGVFERAGEPLALVGHSYGAAVALIAALQRPQRVRALVLYEPTLFALVDAQQPPPNDTDGIRNAVARAVEELERADPAAAARHFIDFWMEPGSFDAMSAERQAPIARSITQVRHWSHALLREPAPLAAFARLQLPVLLMQGTRSPPSSRAVARLLAGALPRVRVLELPGMGHMGPVTHPDIVNGAIAQFLAERMA